MKKKLNLVLVALLVFTLTGCGKPAESSETDKPVTNENIETEVKDKEKEEVSNSEVSLEMVKKAPETDESKFEYEEIDGGVVITKYLGEDKIVVIPKKMNGKNVVELGDQAFVNNEKLEGVKIADTITTLGIGGFANCINLKVVAMGDSVKELKNQVFLMCESLQEVELNDGLEIMGASCFSYTDALKEIYIPDSVVEIDSPFLQGISEVTIITEAGSAAEQYANEAGFECKIK